MKRMCSLFFGCNSATRQGMPLPCPNIVYLNAMSMRTQPCCVPTFPFHRTNPLHASVLSNAHSGTKHFPTRRDTALLCPESE